MIEERKNIDNLLRDKFSSFEGDIPMSDWLAIEEKLNSKRRFAWIWWAAIPLLIIAGLSFYSWFLPVTQTTSGEETKLKGKSKEIVISQNADSKTEIENSSVSKQQSNEVSNKAVEPDHDMKNPSSNSVDGKSSNKQNSSDKESNDENLQPDQHQTIPKVNDPIQPETEDVGFEILNNLSKPVPQMWNETLASVELAKELELTAIKSRIARKSPDITCEIGLNLSPARGQDDMKRNRNGLTNRAFFPFIAGSSSLGTGFNTGVNFQMNFGKNWFFRTGVYSTNYSVYHNYDYTIFEKPRVNGLNEITDYIPDQPETVKHDGKASIKYLSIPFMAGTRMALGKRFGIEAKVGMNISRLLNAEGKTVNPTFLNIEDINSNNSIRKWTSGLTISAGVFYKSKNNFIFTVEPNFSTLLGSAKKKDYAVKTRYYSTGLHININYVLKGGKK